MRVALPKLGILFCLRTARKITSLSEQWSLVYVPGRHLSVSPAMKLYGTLTKSTNDISSSNYFHEIGVCSDGQQNTGFKGARRRVHATNYGVQLKLDQTNSLGTVKHFVKSRTK